MPQRVRHALVMMLVLALAIAAAACRPLEPRDPEREKNAGGGGTMLRDAGGTRSY
jgi:hypothetical protein